MTPRSTAAAVERAQRAHGCVVDWMKCSTCERIAHALAAHLRALADDPAAVERVARWIKDRFYPRYAAWEHLDDMTRNDLLDDARVALAAVGREA